MCRDKHKKGISSVTFKSQRKNFKHGYMMPPQLIQWIYATEAHYTSVITLSNKSSITHNCSIELSACCNFGLNCGRKAQLSFIWKQLRLKSTELNEGRP